MAEEIKLPVGLDLSQIQSQAQQISQVLNKLNLTESMKKQFADLFSSLNSNLEAYSKRYAEGFTSKKDVTNFQNMGKAISTDINLIDKMFRRIQDSMNSMSPKKMQEFIKLDPDIAQRLEAVGQEIEVVKKRIDSLAPEQMSERLKKALDPGQFASGAGKKFLPQIQELVDNGKIDEAIALVDKFIKKQDSLLNGTTASRKSALQKELDAVGGKIENLDPALQTAYKNLQATESTFKTNIANANELRKALVDMGAEAAPLKEHLKILEGEQKETLKEQVERTSTAISGATTNTEKLNSTVREYRNNAEGAAMAQVNFRSELDQLGSRVKHFFSLTNSVMLFRRAIKSALNTVKDLDKVMTETAVVTNFSVGDMWDQLPEYSKRASELGVSIHSAYEAATLYYQQGLKTNQVVQVSNATLKMARIAGLEASEATDRMTNALRGFNMEINETNADNIADVYSKLAAMSASNVDEISTAMTKVASLANNANMSFENTAAFLSQIVETTRESAETAGTALKTVIARFSEVKSLYSEGELKGNDSEGEAIDVNKVSTALRTAGVDLNEYLTGAKGLDDIFIELASKWDKLDQVQQRYIATMAAGSRQQSRFIALMSDYKRTQELTAAANNAAGASQEQYEKTLDSLETKLNKLKNAWDTFLMGLTNNEIIKGAVDVLTWLVEAINKVVGAISGDNGLVKSLATLMLSFGALKLGKMAFASITGTLATGIKSSMIGQQRQFTQAGEVAGLGLGKGVILGTEKSTKQLRPTLIQRLRATFKKSFTPNEVGLSDKIIPFNQINWDKQTKETIYNVKASLHKSINGQAIKIRSEIDSPEGVAKFNSDLQGLHNSVANLNFDEAQAQAKELGINLEITGDQATNMGVKLENVKARTNSLQAGFMGLASTLMLLPRIVSAFGGDMGKTGEILQNVGMVLMAFPVILKVVEFAVKAFCKATGTAILETPVLGWIAAVITAVLALAALLANILPKAKSDEEKLNDLKESYKQLNEQQQQLNEQIDELTSKRAELEKMTDAFSGLVKGSREWKQQLLKINNIVLDLIDKYPELSAYVGRGEYGELTISDEGYDKVIDSTLNRLNNTQTASIYQQIQINKTEQDVQLKRINEAFNKGLISSRAARAQQDALFDKIETSNELLQESIADSAVSSQGVDLSTEAGKLTAEVQKTLDKNTVEAIDEEKRKLASQNWGKDDITLKQQYAQSQGLYYDSKEKKIYDKQGGSEINISKDAMLSTLAAQQYNTVNAANTPEVEKIFQRIEQDNTKKNSQEYKVLKALIIKDGSLLTSGILDELNKLTSDEKIKEFFKELGLSTEELKQLGITAELINDKGMQGIDIFDNLYTTLPEARTDEIKPIVDEFKKNYDLSYGQASKLVQQLGNVLDVGGDVTEVQDIITDILGNIESPADQDKILDLISATQFTNAESWQQTFDSIISTLPSLKDKAEDWSDALVNATNATFNYTDKLAETTRNNFLKSSEAVDKMISDNNYTVNADTKQLLLDSGAKEEDFIQTGEEEYTYLGTFEGLLNQIKGTVENIYNFGAGEGKNTKNTGKTIIETIEGYDEAIKKQKELADSLSEKEKLKREEINNVLSGQEEIGYNYREYINPDNKDQINIPISSPDEWKKISNTQFVRRFEQRHSPQEMVNKYFKTRLLAKGLTDYQIQKMAEGATMDSSDEKNNEGKYTFITKERANEIWREIQEEVDIMLNSDTSHEAESKLIQFQQERVKAIAQLNSLYSGKIKNSSDVSNLVSTREEIENINNDYLSEQQKTTLYSEIDKQLISLIKSTQGANDQFKALKDTYGNVSDIGAGSLAITQTKLKKAIEETSESIKDNIAVLKEAKKGSFEYNAAVAKLSRNLNKIFESTGKNFLDEDQMEAFTKDNLSDLAAWADGSEEAANRVVKAYLKVAYANEELTDNVKKMAQTAGAEVSTVPDLLIAAGDYFSSFEEGALVNLKDSWVKTMEVLINSLGLTLEQAETLFTSLHLEAVVKQTKDGLVIEGLTKRSVFNGFSGFGGYDGSDKDSSGSGSKYEPDYDILYNLIADLEAIQKAEERIVEELEELKENPDTTPSQVVNKLTQLISLYKDNYELETQRLRARQAQGERVMSDNSALQQYATLNTSTGVVHIDYDKIYSVTNEDEGKKIDDYISQLEEIGDEIVDAQDQLDEISDKVEELRDYGRDDYLELEERTFDSLIKLYQDQIDELSNINESINNANDKLLEGIRDSIDKQRQERDNKKTEEEIENTAAKLAYLQMDTSGSNQVDILNLQKQLDDQRQSYTDSLIDQKINELEDQNRVAQEQREQQIQIAQSQLDYAQENGQYWTDILAIINNNRGALSQNTKAAMDAAGITDMASLLKYGDGWIGKSQEQQRDWQAEYSKQFAAASVYVSGGVNDKVRDVQKHFQELQNGKGTPNVYLADIADKKWTVYVDSSGTGNYVPQISGGNGDFDPKDLNQDYKVNSKDYMLAKQQGNIKLAEEIRTAMGMPAEIKAEVKTDTNGLKYLATKNNRYFPISEKQEKQFNENGVLSISKNTPYYRQLNGLIKYGDILKEDILLTAYKTGGLADFTGPAWLDGTKSRPELVLNQTDTENFLKLREILSQIMSMPRLGIDGVIENMSSLYQNSKDDKRLDAIYNALHALKNAETNLNIDIDIDRIENEEDITELIERIKQEIYDEAMYRNTNVLNLIR